MANPAAHLIAHVEGGSTVNGVTTSAIDTSNSTLLVAIGASFEGATEPTLSDSKSNTWIPLTAQSITANSRCRMFYVLSPSVGSGHTFTWSGTGTAPSICVMAFAGNITAFDQQNGATTPGNASTQATGSITPSSDNALVVAGLSGGMTGNFSLNGIGALTGSKELSAGNYFASAAGYGIQGTAAAVNLVFGWSGPSSGSNPVAVIASFTIAASGGSSGGSYGFA